MDFEVLQKKLRPLFEKHNIEKAILFGSFARNESTRHSDLDLILVQKTHLRFLERYDGLLAFFSQALPGLNLDILIYTPEELAGMSERRFIRQALEEGRVLYESK